MPLILSTLCSSTGQRSDFREHTSTHATLSQKNTQPRILNPCASLLGAENTSQILYTVAAKDRNTPPPRRDDLTKS